MEQGVLLVLSLLSLGAQGLLSWLPAHVGVADGSEWTERDASSLDLGVTPQQQPFTRGPVCWLERGQLVEGTLQVLCVDSDDRCSNSGQSSNNRNKHII